MSENSFCSGVVGDRKYPALAAFQKVWKHGCLATSGRIYDGGWPPKVFSQTLLSRGGNI